MQVLRHNTSMPNEKKWLRKSYLWAMPSNMRSTWFFLASSSELT